MLGQAHTETVAWVACCSPAEQRGRMPAGTQAPTLVPLLLQPSASPANLAAWAALTPYFQVSIQPACLSARPSASLPACLPPHLGEPLSQQCPKLHWRLPSLCSTMLCSSERCPCMPPAPQQIGDWHDVLFLPVASPMGGSAAVRFQPG
jgi:hypothetical protein